MRNRMKMQERRALVCMRNCVKMQARGVRMPTMTCATQKAGQKKWKTKQKQQCGAEPKCDDSGTLNKKLL